MDYCAVRLPRLKRRFFSYSHKIITLILRSAPAVAVSASLHLVARSNVFQLVHKYFPHQPRGLAAGSTSLQELAKQNITIERDFLRGGNHRSQLFSSLLHSLAQASSSTTSWTSPSSDHHFFLYPTLETVMVNTQRKLFIISPVRGSSPSGPVCHLQTSFHESWIRPADLLVIVAGFITVQQVSALFRAGNCCCSWPECKLQSDRLLGSRAEHLGEVKNDDFHWFTVPVPAEPRGDSKLR